MSASQLAYKKLIDEYYTNKVRGCPECEGLNPECHCMNRFLLLCKIAQTNIPFKFRYAKVDKFSPNDGDKISKKDIEKYINNLETVSQQGIGLLFSGSVSSGKTLLICAILIAAIKKNLSAYYIDINDFFRLQEMRYSDQSDKYQKKIKHLNEADILAIDGIGFGIQGKTASKQALAYLFQDRILAKKVTFIGSTVKDLTELSIITPDFPDLVKEGCPKEICLTGQDFIEQEHEKKKQFFDNLK